jgi:hypothetical protein
LAGTWLFAVNWQRKSIHRAFAMKKLPLLRLAVLLALSATARAGSIDAGTPLISGNVETSEGRHSAARTDLSPDQLRALSRWLEQHRSGWQGMVTPAGSEAAQLGVNLNHSDGSCTAMAVIARAGGGHYLRLAGPHKWAYRSFLGIFKSWAATRPLSDQELAALRNLVGAR